MEMVIDFHPSNPPNTIMTWEKIDGEWKWVRKTLSTMIAGDTDSGMFEIPSVITDNHPVEEVVEFADGIGEIVNESFAEFCEFAFNCPPDRNKIIETDREVVSDKSFFLTKKRYIMHIVNDEGKWVDKLKIQGVEIKKSDASEAVKKYLMDLVLLILDDVPRDEVMDAIEDMRKEFYQLPATEIATPVSTNTLGKINETYRITGSLHGAHYGAKSAFYWNKFRNSTDPEIYPGQKVGVVYVKNNETTSIGFPTDMEIDEMPQWFLDMPLNYDRMWEGVKKKLTNYIEVLGWDITSQKKEKRRHLFGA